MSENTDHLVPYWRDIATPETAQIAKSHSKGLEPVAIARDVSPLAGLEP